MDQRHPALARQRRKLARGDLRGEALDAVVRRVHLEDQARSRGPIAADIVLRMRAVGGADLDELGAGAAS